MDQKKLEQLLDIGVVLGLIMMAKTIADIGKQQDRLSSEIIQLQQNAELHRIKHATVHKPCGCQEGIDDDQEAGSDPSDVVPVVGGDQDGDSGDGAQQLDAQEEVTI